MDKQINKFAKKLYFNNRKSVVFIKGAKGYLESFRPSDRKYYCRLVAETAIIQGVDAAAKAFPEMIIW